MEQHTIKHNLWVSFQILIRALARTWQASKDSIDYILIIGEEHIPFYPCHFSK